MTGLHQNIEDILARLLEKSRGELDLVRTLADAIRRVDDNLLREVRSVTLQHEVRREAIFGELQNLATRLCSLPAHNGSTVSMAAIDQQTHTNGHAAIDAVQSNAGGADWRQAAQNITEDHDEFDFEFATHRH
jgi:hypothetical protein